MCSKFHLDNLKAVGGAWETTFYKQTTTQQSTDSDIPTHSWGYNKKTAIIVYLHLLILGQQLVYKRSTKYMQA